MAHPGSRHRRFSFEVQRLTGYHRGMYVAPSVAFTGTLAAAPSGGGAVFHTVRLMREAVNRCKTDPRIINAATTALFHSIERDEVAECAALYRTVRSWIRYVKDVYGVETLAEPWLTLERRAGDCDDQAALLAAMYESVGFPTRFVMAAYNDPAFFEHIYLQVFCDGEWCDVDPTENFGFGSAPPDPVNVWIEGES